MVLTKLDASGNKNISYVPANGLVTALQQKDYNGNPTIGWQHRDASGLQQSGQAYDPFGNLIYNVQPPMSPPPPYVPFYGASWGGASWNSFATANNLAAGCNVGGFPMDCSRAMIANMGIEFVMNLPGSHLDNVYAEASYASNFAISTMRWVKDP